MRELGHPELVAYAWAGVLAPAGTPAAIVDRLSRELAAVLANAPLQAKLAAISTEPVGSAPAEFARFLSQEEQANGKLIRELHISLD